MLKPLTGTPAERQAALTRQIGKFRAQSLMYWESLEDFADEVFPHHIRLAVPHFHKRIYHELERIILPAPPLDVALDESSNQFGESSNPIETGSQFIISIR